MAGSTVERRQPGAHGGKIGRMSRTAITAHQVTRALQRVREGDRGALDELMPLVYGELRRIAGSFMQRQRRDHTLQPTAVVNEAFIKLFHDTVPQLADRAHFLAVMSKVMRQVLVDHARSQGAAKRGGGEPPVAWDTNIEVATERGCEHVELLDLHRALEALTRENAALGQLVEMHYFGGMTAEEAAVVLERSVHAVRHDLRFARAWLHRQLAH
jgi:RNA polymerase sigma-70 factor, ECF subfamily